ncbi:MAG TPA: ABC transporter permease [Acidimicrobiales bacterium]|nr:ABC transporter permease [Acidimicrobiales bacterium]
MLDTTPDEGLLPASRYAERGQLRKVLDVVFRRTEMTIFLVAISLIAYFSIRNANFYSLTNIITMTQYIAPIAVVGAGEVLLLDLAEIDLSAGQVYLTAPWFVVLLSQHGLPVGWGIVISLLGCVAIGAFNGIVVVSLKVPSFVATLGTNYVLAGFVLVASSQIQANMVGTTGNFGKVLAISDWSEGLWGLGIVLVIWALLKGTRFGLHTTATGGNELGSAEAGIRVRHVKVLCFVVIALICGIIGILDAVRIGSLDPAAPGLNMMLSGVSAAVIGGTALTGGKATVLGTLIGAIVLGVLEDGFNLIGISANWFILVEGGVILVAMGINVQLGRITTRTAR